MGRSKDSIKVFLRVRPVRTGFGLDGSANRYDVEHSFDESKIVFHADGRHREEDVVNHSVNEYKFKFDRVFDQDTTQEAVYDAIAKDCVSSVVQGFNSTIFAYGQTGSGKTYTITGGTESYDDRGIIPRAIAHLFKEMQERSDCAWSISVSYMQIYNEKAQDLLNRGKDARSLDELPVVTVHDTDEEVLLRNLEAHPVSSVSDTLNLLFLGDTNRLYCETAMNKTSSRSHCIFTLMIEARPHGSATVRRSKLNLVDLAGSERVAKTGATGQILTEAKHINLSLHYLEHVITALSEATRGIRDHIPYRNSTMTEVLRDSLGGNCRTAMLATAHPGEHHLMETISTCRFAMRVSSIQQRAVVNEETDPTILIRNLKKEVVALKDQVAFLSDGKDSDPNRELSADELQRCREMVQQYVADTSPDARLTGVGSDLARIMACFAIMKEIITKSPQALLGDSGAASVGATGRQLSSSTAVAAAVDGPALEQEMAELKATVLRLQASVKQKENELSVMMGALGEKGSVSRRHAITQTPVGPGEAMYDAQFVTALAAGPRDRPATNGADGLSASTAVRDVGFNATAPARPRQSDGSLNRQPTDAIALDPVGSPPSAAGFDAEAATLARVPSPQQQRLVDDYDLGALCDESLLRDRQAAFEKFRKSFRKSALIEKTQDEIRDRMGEAKRIAPGINALIDEIKAAKAQISQLKADRALQGDPTLDDNSREAELTRSLQEVLRPEYNKLTAALKAEKGRIEHLQLMMSRTREQMVKDFDAWFAMREKQLAMAGAKKVGGGSAGAAGAAGGAQLPLRRPSSVAVAGLTPQPPGGSGRLGGAEAALAASAPPAVLLSGRHAAPLGSYAGLSASGHFPSMSHALAAGSGAAAVRLTPPASAEASVSGAAPGPVLLGGVAPPMFQSTGNPAADAELAKMYAARDERRRQLMALQGQQPK